MLPTRDFLSLRDHPAHDLLALVRRADELKRFWDERRTPPSLRDRRIALVVDDGGWRNTTAFDLGIQAMGGLCIHVPIERETTEDLGRYLDNWFDAVVVRTRSLSDLRELAAAMRSPVINARTRTNHPCEILGDLSFIWSQRHSLDGLKVAAVAGDDNILRSWVEAAAVLPIQVVQVFSKRWHLHDPTLLTSQFRANEDMRELADADVLVTDCWPEHSLAEDLLPFQITARILDNLRPEAAFIPCPPVARGQEVSEDAMRSPLCRAVEAKNFLLHAQNALLEWILAGSS
jgi:ornithine carbamoyltransferase